MCNMYRWDVLQVYLNVTQMNPETEYLQKIYFFKNISKNLSDKYSEKPLDHVKQLAIHALKSPQKRAT